ncbi:hypothetical protein BD324DRAFT_607967 [Kockovaella imperatae]|uniref:Uncharacterized protein n=1 Tax=Kockovaella imperatae TaxID=4999 RepID=A0A1Y1UN10_9TREE|nr:hypothetical protein BD324DRAFT_607967 [Kockovaella imperatae]ORX38515.1 hypothetical protein BD324DRAFT_607967 [Kockovaella imperatae]
MKDSKSVRPFKRQTPLLHKATNNKSASQNRSPPREKTGTEPSGVDDSLAVCLFGLSRAMYDSEYEEEVRKQAVMSEVLPDAKMWEKWEKTEAPLRQGRGWYPALDRHFLELLVMSEIHCLSHPLHPIQQGAGQVERIHRHACRVRRVACERIGAERLNAYCERVKEAFEAYVHCGWGQRQMGDAGGIVTTDDEAELQDDDMDTETDTDTDTDTDTSPSNGNNGLEGPQSELGSIDSTSQIRSAGGSIKLVVEEGESRGRSKERGDGSVRRDPGPGPEVSPPPFSPSSILAKKALGEINEVSGDDLLDGSVDEIDAGELMKVDLDDVEENDEQVEGW